MREVLFRVSHLLSRPSIFWRWVVLAALGVILTWVPLLDQPGYELATGLALLLTCGGGTLCITAARAPRSGSLACGLLLALATLPALLLATFRTLVFTPCNPFVDSPFVPLLVVPTVALVAVLGVAAARLTKRWWLAHGFYLQVVRIIQADALRISPCIRRSTSPPGS